MLRECDLCALTAGILPIFSCPYYILSQFRKIQFAIKPAFRSIYAGFSSRSLHRIAERYTYACPSGSSKTVCSYLSRCSVSILGINKNRKCCSVLIRKCHGKGGFFPPLLLCDRLRHKVHAKRNAEIPAFFGELRKFRINLDVPCRISSYSASQDNTVTVGFNRIPVYDRIVL